MRWFADDSDLKTINDVNVPNIVLFGGIAVPQDQERDMREAIETAKERFGHRRAPVKWNFKDLKRKYEEQSQADLYNDLMNNMFDLRRSIFDAASEFDFCMIFSLVKGYSTKKKVLKDVKQDLARYVFTNSLMRFALHVSDAKPEYAEVVLDWPDGGDSKPYDSEYASAFNQGRTKDGVQYNSGSLASLNFYDSPVYARMPHNTIMQFSDLVLGATRELVNHSLKPKKSGHGLTLLNTVAHKYRGYPNNVIGRGISVNSKATDVKKAIGDKFRELYVNS